MRAATHQLWGLRPFVWRFGAAVALTQLLLGLEAARTMRVAGSELAGGWEDLLVAQGVTAIALLAAAPALVVVLAFATMLPIALRKAGRAAWTTSAALVAMPLAIELSTGRKARALAFRVPFVVGVTLVACALAWWILPHAVALGRRHRWLLPLVGVVVLGATFEADLRVLPRLYPAFHAALLATMAVGVLLIGELAVVIGRAWWALAFVVDVFAIWGSWRIVSARGRVAWAGQGLATYENARRVVDERSPILARAAALAARKWPPPPLEPLEGEPDPLAASSARTLRADGRDLLLVTIDALRADHVGAYGYARKTTPALDALAAEGVVFEHAYTPTPHTSYAISSLMTGKYLRPILQLEAAAGGARRPDETWAGLLRAYGFRTAAFYPPAIFFVDAERFADLQQRGLDFEYAKVEFAAPDLRASQVEGYLKAAPTDHPLFVWVHLFEPHEPYLKHAAHDFGDGEVDRYDSEIAAADAGLGSMVRAFRAARPGGVVIVTADHGEAFGDHGARYHGTTVYEEQVRVPLVVSAPGLVAQRRVRQPVQLVDLMPTLLSAYGIPKPPRVRGRDLGAWLAAPEPPVDDGVAFAEVDDASMFARGDDRLVCLKRAAACTVYDVATDPAEAHALADPTKIEALRRAMGGLVAASAKLEGFELSGATANAWPDALRRAFAGDAEAAIDVAPLLDDVDVGFRRRAAEALARLGRAETTPHVARALTREKDPLAHAWLVIARVRTARPYGPAGVAGVGLGAAGDAGEVARMAALRPALAKLSALLLDVHPDVADFAALALGESARAPELAWGADARARAFERLVAWFPRARADAELARALLDALVSLRVPQLSRLATPSLLSALDDVRLRLPAAEALGLLGDAAAIAPLGKRLAQERHLDARAPEALALARLGARDLAIAELGRVLSVPSPAPGGGEALRESIGAGALPPWFVRPQKPGVSVHVRMLVPKAIAHRLVVVGPKQGKLRVVVLGLTKTGEVGEAGGLVELDDVLRTHPGAEVELEIGADQAIAGIALLPRIDDLPPPKRDRGLGEP
jgi:arylsulfatase A-like enzyme